MLMLSRLFNHDDTNRYFSEVIQKGSMPFASFIHNTQTTHSNKTYIT